MNIVCIAWGSLLWKPGPLKLASGWHPGGPLLPLEFARDSDDSDELALVLCAGAPAVPTYWAYVDAPDLAAARAMLAAREKIAPGHPEFIGSIPAVGGAPVQHEIAAWLGARRIDAAIWTALPPKFAGSGGRMPSATEVVAFLASLAGETRQAAEFYLRRTPPHIDTPYRRVIARSLGWHPLREAGVTRMY
ncbi:hypothetical protein [Pseudoduganella albidiflava]|uniref:DUF2285 domain-containing protein n=1 Tax=Pseudoduganella albidiflava TaxID=321983 RepID=A0A411WXY6_9BURK|nr:hypothetical protein [Pseudoduganella albidiflava]QBI01569.1 hypothetical protein EYF70_12435 [Pseudoduganella albidiflava]GGY34669.1 hypothetical protein GCM10007387_15790 [Pseudoduganella albidiflava]